MFNKKLAVKNKLKLEIESRLKLIKSKTGNKYGKNDISLI